MDDGSVGSSNIIVGSINLPGEESVPGCSRHEAIATKEEYGNVCMLVKYRSSTLRLVKSVETTADGAH